MELRAVPYEQARPLVEALVAEMIARYGGGSPSPSDPQEFVPPYGVFMVVSDGGVDLACGGVRKLRDNIGELKRMYVVPGARRRGISRLLLKELVDQARTLGYAELWLETGTAQPEAIALYESEGFQLITPYGQYKDDPDSRCYRLVIDT
jgi:GNAT superfamily N-acetyltransferase